MEYGTLPTHILPSSLQTRSDALVQVRYRSFGLSKQREQCKRANFRVRLPTRMGRTELSTKSALWMTYVGCFTFLPFTYTPPPAISRFAASTPHTSFLPQLLLSANSIFTKRSGSDPFIAASRGTLMRGNSSTNPAIMSVVIASAFPNSNSAQRFAFSRSSFERVEIMISSTPHAFRQFKPASSCCAPRLSGFFWCSVRIS